jgi:hypothetical protein
LLGLAVTSDAVADFLKTTQLLDFNVDVALAAQSLDGCACRRRRLAWL